MAIQKGDLVRAKTLDYGGNGFVHYILPCGEAMVEFAVWGRMFLHTSILVKVED